MDHAKDFRIKTTHYIIAGFSLVVGLSWNDTIKQILNKLFPLETDFLLTKIIYLHSFETSFKHSL